jgi:hypothetical protein
MFAARNVEFVSLDIIKDALPNGELCLIRQAMQHLSNSEISGILKKVRKFPHAIIAEHYPEIEGTPNIDIEPGAHTRSGENSAVYLDKPPFSVSHMSLMAEKQNRFTLPWILTYFPSVVGFCLRALAGRSTSSMLATITSCPG